MLFSLLRSTYSVQKDNVLLRNGVGGDSFNCYKDAPNPARFLISSLSHDGVSKPANAYRLVRFYVNMGIHKWRDFLKSLNDVTSCYRHHVIPSPHKMSTFLLGMRWIEPLQMCVVLLGATSRGNTLHCLRAWRPVGN